MTDYGIDPDRESRLEKEDIPTVDELAEVTGQSLEQLRRDRDAGVCDGGEEERKDE